MHLYHMKTSTTREQSNTLFEALFKISPNMFRLYLAPDQVWNYKLSSGYCGIFRTFVSQVLIISSTINSLRRRIEYALRNINWTTLHKARKHTLTWKILGEKKIILTILSIGRMCSWVKYRISNTFSSTVFQASNRETNDFCLLNLCNTDVYEYIHYGSITSSLASKFHEYVCINRAETLEMKIWTTNY